MQEAVGHSIFSCSFEHPNRAISYIHTMHSRFTIHSVFLWFSIVDDVALLRWVYCYVGADDNSKTEIGLGISPTPKVK